MTNAECRMCGCTDDDACVDPELGPCWWVEEDLCSHCALGLADPADTLDDDFDDLLAELADAGLLGVPPLGRYGYRPTQVVTSPLLCDVPRRDRHVSRAAKLAVLAGVVWLVVQGARGLLDAVRAELRSMGA